MPLNKYIFYSKYIMPEQVTLVLVDGGRQDYHTTPPLFQSLGISQFGSSNPKFDPSNDFPKTNKYRLISPQEDGKYIGFGFDENSFYKATQGKHNGKVMYHLDKTDEIGNSLNEKKIAIKLHFGTPECTEGRINMGSYNSINDKCQIIVEKIVFKPKSKGGKSKSRSNRKTKKSRKGKSRKNRRKSSRR